MPLIPSREREYISYVFGGKLKGPVELQVFTSGSPDCNYCSEMVDLAKELSELSAGKVSYRVTKLEDDGGAFKENGIIGPPTLKVVSPSRKFNARYTGMPAGYEFGALIDDIIDASRGATRLSPSTLAQVRSIDADVDIRVFVTPTCPYCPRAVRVAHMFAMENERITGDMVEALEFPSLAEKYGVMSVPHIVINDSYMFVGALPENMFLEHVLKAARGESAFEVTAEGVSPLK